MWGSKGTQYKSQFLWLLPAQITAPSPLNFSSPGSGFYFPSFSLWSYITQPFWLPFSWFPCVFSVLLGPYLSFLSFFFLPPSFLSPLSSHSPVSSAGHVQSWLVKTPLAIFSLISTTKPFSSTIPRTSRVLFCFLSQVSLGPLTRGMRGLPIEGHCLCSFFLNKNIVFPSLQWAIFDMHHSVIFSFSASEAKIEEWSLLKRTLTQYVVKETAEESKVRFFIFHWLDWLPYWLLTEIKNLTQP